MTPFSCVVIGEELLLVQCGMRLLDAATRSVRSSPEIPRSRAWAEAGGCACRPRTRISPARLDHVRLAVQHRQSRDRPRLGAREGGGTGRVNFHDGPLPRYAGLNAPVWALLDRETQPRRHLAHDGRRHRRRRHPGPAPASRSPPDETALTLNAKCYAAAIESFDELCRRARGRRRAAHARRTCPSGPISARDARPRAAARLDFRRDAEELAALVRALDHGAYWNPLACPEIEIGGRILLSARPSPPAPAAAQSRAR